MAGEGSNRAAREPFAPAGWRGPRAPARRAAAAGAAVLESALPQGQVRGPAPAAGSPRTVGSGEQRKSSPAEEGLGMPGDENQRTSRQGELAAPKADCSWNCETISMASRVREVVPSVRFMLFRPPPGDCIQRQGLQRKKDMDLLEP